VTKYVSESPLKCYKISLTETLVYIVRFLIVYPTYVLIARNKRYTHQQVASDDRIKLGRISLIMF